MKHALLNDIVIIFALSIAVGFICHRVRLPKVVGFLLTGLLTGPHGLALVGAVEEVNELAEIGVELLLFTIGMEFSMKRLLRIRRAVLLGGSLQVGFTIAAVGALALWLGQNLNSAIFMGFLVALSSTAIVLRLLQERAEIDTPHGRTTLAILIFQDLVVVPMMLVTPLLVGGPGAAPLESGLLLLGKGIAIVVAATVAARWLAPTLLFQIARTGSRELFLLTVLVICFSVAWMTSALGLSLALGAFLAGLVISESDYGHESLSHILPFRDVFTSFFFVSIGMLLDVRFLLEHPARIVLGVLLVIGVKGLLAGITTGFLGFPLRAMVLVGLALSQVGEFSFILANAGIEHGFLSKDLFQSFLAISILTMVITPLLIPLGPRIAARASRWLGLSGWRSNTGSFEIPDDAQIRDHLIIVGFGLNGKNLARAARAAGIPYVVLEMNPETVRKERARGENIYYGDAGNEPVLHHVRIEDARVLVVAINDPAAIRGIVEMARKLNPGLHVIVRTRYLLEVGPLCNLGADEVIPEEFETSVEIFTRVLRNFLVPGDEIERMVSEVRSDSYEMLRDPPATSQTLSDLPDSIPDLQVISIRVAEESSLNRKSLAELELRKRHGVTVVAMRRGNGTIINPDPFQPIQTGDILVLVGPRGKMSPLLALVRGAVGEEVKT
jgi:monovalent cation:H+ antiporter-2, CPA2 family